MAGKTVSSNRFRTQEPDDDPAMAGGWQGGIDGAYTPSDFIIPGSDHQGHSERIYCRVHPQHARALSKILNSHKFPFRTQGDIQRWCVVRGLKVLEKLEPVCGFMGAADAITEVLKQEMYMQEFTMMFQSMSGVIQNHLSSGAEGEARKLLSVVLGHIRKIDEPFWKKKAEEEVRSRFAHLLEGKGNTVSLRVKGEEVDQ
jgi:hypothetical protein